MQTALTIAGSDSSGGAGIQADLKTMLANGVYGMSAITALTAQNTTGVTGIMEVSPEFLEKEIDAVFTDIRPDAVKIGMVSSAVLIHVIAEKLKEYKATNVVVDPVMVSTSGARLLEEHAEEILQRELLPLADVITPNIPEAEVLSGRAIGSEADMERAADKIAKKLKSAAADGWSNGKPVSILLKGGHSVSDSNDLLYHEGKMRWFKGRRIDNPNTHGTGCTLSSAIASNLAKGQGMEEAVSAAKEYISGALEAGLDLGKGSGPLDHGYILRNCK